jgi:hypothetical protein
MQDINNEANNYRKYWVQQVNIARSIHYFKYLMQQVRLAIHA